MGEHEPHFESSKSHENLIDPEHHKSVEKAMHEKAEKARQGLSQERLEQLHELAKQQAEAKSDTIIEERRDQEPDNISPGVLKSHAYDRTMRSIQQKLPKSGRLFSKAAHNKTVEAVSNAGAKTVARPSGLLGGSICAFAGSIVLLYYSKHYGFTYNYGLFLLLFAGGFLIGAAIELVVWTVHRSKHGGY